MSSSRPFIILLALLIATTLTWRAEASDGRSAVFEARLLSSTLKVFTDSVPTGKPGTPLKIVAVRNEYAPFQVAVSVLSGRSDFSVALSPLTGGTDVIEVPATSMLLVENVIVKKASIPAKEAGEKSVTVLLPARWPDPLPPLKIFSADEGETRAVWIDLFVPSHVAPGVHKGIVAVSSADGGRIELSIEVDVRDITLPTTPTVRTAFGNGSLQACVEKVHHVTRGSPEYQKILEDYYWSLVEHRLSPYHIPVDIYSDEAHRFLDDPRVTFFVIPMDWGAGKESRIWNDEEMRRLSRRLNQTGWIGKGAFYVIDEPKENAFSDVINVGKRIHSIDPRFRYLMTPDSGKMLFHRELMKEASVDIWVPMLTVMSAPDERAVLLKEQEKGKELWWYTCVVPKWKGMNYFIDEAATAPRLHPWMNYLYGSSGILYWATDNWSGVDCNPWLKTETYPTGNGDGSLLYPGKDFKGPVASIRLKMLREGLEDYELLRLLGERLKRVAEIIGGRAVDYRPEDRLFEHAFSLITEEGRSHRLGSRTPYLMYVTRDFQDIEIRRELVIAELERVFEPPLLLVGSFPFDNGYTTNDTATIRGYAKDDTTVEVNSKRVLQNDRAFQTIVPLLPGKNVIAVKATDNQGNVKTTCVTIGRQ
jgi:hypothetical protein